MGDQAQQEINTLLAWRAAEWREFYRNEAEAAAVMLVASRPDLLDAANGIAARR